ncbi:hypothetical protein AP3564_10965 [Aeribacillus pallidus]|uniref:Uncharacterized protein n=1 Tax=Aeribacillus pallidus TaxID=33936 RepID=A0A223E644_9BACI|nr:hypothetical protein AP3564_10965 [Aeribacillus pallidus]
MFCYGWEVRFGQFYRKKNLADREDEMLQDFSLIHLWRGNAGVFCRCPNVFDSLAERENRTALFISVVRFQTGNNACLLSKSIFLPETGIFAEPKNHDVSS